MKFLRAVYCGAAIIACGFSGCQWFGIDTRPGIEWLTIHERRPVKEPMYQRTIPEAGLVKRWPAKFGVDYGYAPWEKKTDATMVSQDGTIATATTAAPVDPRTPRAANAPAVPNGANSPVQSVAAHDAMPGRNQQAVYNAPVVASDNSPGVEHADWTSRGPIAPGTARPRTPAKKPSMPPAPAGVSGAPTNVPGGDAEVQPRSVRTRAPQLFSAPPARSIESGDEPDAAPVRTSQLPDVNDPSDYLPTPETAGGGPLAFRSVPAAPPRRVVQQPDAPQTEAAPAESESADSPELTEISNQFGVGDSKGGRSR